MTYKRFSQIWDEVVANSQPEKDPMPITSCSEETAQALIEYGQGNKTKINNVRRFLGR